MKIYLVRHGQSEGNVRELWYGSSDLPLTDLGRQQARESGEKLRGVSFAACYASPLIRAKDTADLVKAARAKRHLLPAVSAEPCVMADDWSCVHFVRMRAKDEPGVLAQVAGTFADHGVSISSMVQKGERDEDGYVQLIMLTHRASERAVRMALSQLDAGKVAAGSVIRVEGC